MSCTEVQRSSSESSSAAPGEGGRRSCFSATAAGLVQAGLVDQSMFNDSYRDIESWDDLYEPTRVRMLGLSVYATQAFVVGHVVYSFSAPIALTEAIRPSAARSAWVGWKALSIVALLYARGRRARSQRHARQRADPPFLRTGRRHARGRRSVHRARLEDADYRPQSRRPDGAAAVRRSRRELRAATLLAIAPSTWPGVALSAAVLLLGGFLLVRASPGAGWGMPHVVRSRRAPSSAVDSSPSRTTPSSERSRRLASTHTTSVMLLIVGAVIVARRQEKPPHRRCLGGARRCPVNALGGRDEADSSC